MSDLDRQLNRARQDVLDQIAIPELATVHARARGIRRRRVQIAGTLALVVLALGTGAVLRPSATPPPMPPAASATPTPGWHGAALTLLPLNGPVRELPGTLYQVTFATPTIGYALAEECGDQHCLVWFSSTTDAGVTWSEPQPAPFDAIAPRDLPRVIPVGARAVLARGDESRVATAGVPGWDGHGRVQTVTTVDAVPADGQLVVQLDPAGACAAAEVRAWSANGAPLRLAHQPALQVCRAAAARTADGAWWVGGRSAGNPAVAVSRDEGASWTVTVLPAGPAGSWAQVSTLGPVVFAAVVTADAPPAGAARVHAVYRSLQRGPFEPYSGEIGTIVGDLVPLLDGGLASANGKLQVATGRGQPLQTDLGIPAVGRVERTPGGWIAYDVFLSGWAAVSQDGVAWQKVNVH